MTRETLYPNVVKINRDALDELHRIARAADRMAGEIERLRAVSSAALTVLLKIDEGSSRLPEAVEGLRRALLEANR